MTGGYPVFSHAIRSYTRTATSNNQRQKQRQLTHVHGEVLWRARSSRSALSVRKTQGGLLP